MKSKILYVIPRLQKAGTEQHLINLANNLDRSRFEALICCAIELGSLGQLFSRSGASENIVCLNRKNIYDLRIMADIYKIIKKHRFDIVHAYLFGFNYLATVPARVARVPLIISSRRELATWKKPHHSLLENLSNIFTDKIIACSEAAKEFAIKDERLPIDKIATIYNGIDLKKFSAQAKNNKILGEFGFHKGDRIIGMVTKFAEVKDVATALEAIAKVKDDYPQIKCLIVGDGHLRTEMENKAKYLGIDSIVKFSGLRNDIPQILSIIDVFLLTSLSEGLPNAILEAMACGLPVVSTNAGGIPEAVECGRSGILVEPKDPKAIAAAIVTLLKDDNLRIKMGMRGKEIVEQKFSLDRMVKDYENLYLLLHKRRKGPA